MVQALARLNSAPDEAPPIDVVPPIGGPVRTFVLPHRTRIVGIGPRSLYVAVPDADDVEHIRRYAWPLP